MPAWKRATKQDWKSTGAQRSLMSKNGALNAVLYGMCEDYPHHRDRGAIRAKVVIIGRSYAAGLERHVKGIGSVTDAFYASRSWLDADLARLKRLDDHEPSADRIAAIASVHARLQRALCDVTRKGNKVRSFVSKYLHFHAPVVPIFDQYASAALTDWYRWPPQPAFAKMPVRVDEIYWRHLVRTAFVVEEWRATRCAIPTARAIDSYALAWWETS